MRYKSRKLFWKSFGKCIVFRLWKLRYRIVGIFFQKSCRFSAAKVAVRDCRRISRRIGWQNDLQPWVRWRNLFEGGTKWLSTMEKVKGNNQIPAQQQNFWRFFQKHLDKWLRPLGISEGALSGINFDANAEISVQKAASILMPQTKNGSDSEPRISGNGKMAPIRSQK